MTSADAPPPPDGPALIVHVHVPKTAGSAINSVLAEAFGPGAAHVEAVTHDAGAFRDVATSAAWIAGHVHRPKMKELLGGLKRPSIFVTALREPSQQVASHYNWLIEIGRRGDAFLESHPAAIQEIHRRIVRSEYGEPKAIVENLMRNEGLFMNCQSQFVIGHEYADHSISYAEVVREFSAIILDGDVGAGLAPLLKGRRIPVPRENASRHHFDREVFHHPHVREFLLDRNRYDHMLWQFARNCVAEGSIPGGNAAGSVRAQINPSP